jgi:hypothetical protein
MSFGFKGEMEIYPAQISATQYVGLKWLISGMSEREIGFANLPTVFVCV